MSLEDLKGRVVQSVWITPDKSVIGFMVDDNEMLLYEAEGDCCSKSWIENVTDAQSFCDVKVLEVNDVEMRAEWTDGEEDSGDLNRFYKTTITGLKYGSGPNIYGRLSSFSLPAQMTIEYRNESNGYYGGSLSRFHFHPNIAADLAEMKEIKADI